MLPGVVACLLLSDGGCALGLQGADLLLEARLLLLHGVKLGLKVVYVLFDGFLLLRGCYRGVEGLRWWRGLGAREIIFGSTLVLRFLSFGRLALPEAA